MTELQQTLHFHICFWCTEILLYKPLGFAVAGQRAAFSLEAMTDAAKTIAMEHGISMALTI